MSVDANRSGSRAASGRDNPDGGRRFATLAGAGGLVLAALAIQLPIVDRSFVSMDEGHLVATAQRLLQGDLLYRDIQTGIFPGIYYLAALLFETLGMDVLVTRWVQVAVNTAIALVLWFAGLRMMRPRWAALAPVAFLALVPLGFPVLTMLNYSTVSLAFGLVALLFMLRYVEENRTLDAVVCGLALALCALTKQNFGALAGLALLLGFLWGRRGSPLANRTVVAGLFPVVVAGGGLTLAAASYFVATGSFADLVHATFTQLLSTQAASFYHPIPPILGSHPQGDGLFVFLYSPPALFGYLIHGESLLGVRISPAVCALAIRLSYGLPLLGLVLAPIVLYGTRETDRGSERRASRVVVVFAGLFFFGIFPSAIWSHLAFVLPPVLLVGAWVGDRFERALEVAKPGGARALYVSCAVGVLLLALLAVRSVADIRRWHPVALGLPRASVYLGGEEALLYRGATAFLEQCARIGEPIFVVPTHPLLYFVTDRPNPTRYDLTIPGDVDGEAIIRALESSRTRCVIFDPDMYPEFPPFEQLFPELADFLDTHYERVAIRGESRTWYGLQRREAREED